MPSQRPILSYVLYGAAGVYAIVGGIQIAKLDGVPGGAAIIAYALFGYIIGILLLVAAGFVCELLNQIADNTANTTRRLAQIERRLTPEAERSARPDEGPSWKL